MHQPEPSAPSSRSTRLSRSTALRCRSVIGSRACRHRHIRGSDRPPAGRARPSPNRPETHARRDIAPRRSGDGCAADPSGSLRIERSVMIFSPGSSASGSSISTAATSALRGRSCAGDREPLRDLCALLRLARGMMEDSLASVDVRNTKGRWLLRRSRSAAVRSCRSSRDIGGKLRADGDRGFSASPAGGVEAASAASRREKDFV